MQYVIKRAAIGCKHCIKIEKNDFEAILDSKEVLSTALTIEEQYLLLISNYEELEKELVFHAVSLTVRPPREYKDFHRTRRVFNTRMINLLSACKLYADHLPHHIKQIVDESSCEDVKSLFSAQYDFVFEYRFMEALRNYAQHRGFPVHKTSHRTFLTQPVSDESNHVHVLDIFSQKERLEDDGCFKAGVLEEMDEEVNLKHVVRRYVECMSAIHEDVRKIIGERISAARELIDSYIERYQRECEAKTIGLVAAMVDEYGVSKERVPMTLKWDDVRIELASSNRLLKKLSLSYASGE